MPRAIMARPRPSQQVSTAPAMTLAAPVLEQRPAAGRGRAGRKKRAPRQAPAAQAQAVGASDMALPKGFTDLAEPPLTDFVGGDLATGSPIDPAACQVRRPTANGRGEGGLVSGLAAHPALTWLVGPARELRWRFAGSSAANPPIPVLVRSVMFVCLGNLYRSPFAAALAKLRAPVIREVEIAWTSAGLRPAEAIPPSDAAHVASARFGVSLAGHSPRRVTPEGMHAFDMVVTMERWQFDQLRRRYPNRRHRIFLLPLFDPTTRGAYERNHIDDPHGQTEQAFSACFERMAGALAAFTAALARPRG